MKTALLALCGAAALAGAQIQYTTQGRYIEAYANVAGEPMNERLDAPGFGSFNETISRTFSNQEGSAWAYATQNSTLLADGILATGAADGSSGPPVGTSFGGGRSVFAVGFTLANDADYTLDLSVFSEFASWSFQGPSLDIDRPFDFAVGDFGVHESGTLAAGDYAFEIVLESGAAAQGLGSNYDFAFTAVPAPGALAALTLGGLAATRRRR